MKSHYKFDDFLSDCALGASKVFVVRSAVQSARSDFNLHTSHSILEFIGKGGLERKRFINSKPWENNKDTTFEIMVDAYHFYSGLFHGYLAFFFQPKTEMWTIKSFKKNVEPDPRYFAFQEQLTKLLARSKHD